MSAAQTYDDWVATMEQSQQDPAWFLRTVLGCEPWRRQVEIMESIRDNRQTAVPSCHSSGKSWVAGRAVLWFLYSFPGSKIITTAPTERQIRGILWGEVHAARKRARFRLGGEPTILRLDLDDDWWAWGFTAPDWDPNRFQGFHAPHILVVVDEAAGISRVMSEQIDSLLSGGHARKLEIGNPVESGTAFEDSCRSSMVKTLPISAFDTPNFTEFGITEQDIINGTWEEKIGDAPMPVPDLITPIWVAERLVLWGVNSNAWKSRVLGEFPDEVIGAYYAKEMKAMRDEGRIGSFPWDPDTPVQTAWDIGIKDSTAIWFFQRHGEWIDFVRYYENTGHGLPHYTKYLADLPYTYTNDHIAPPDMKVREWGSGGVQRTVAAQRLGVNFRVLPRLQTKERGEIAEGIDIVRRLLPRVRMDEEGCSEGIDAMRNYRRDSNPRTGELRAGPKHDWASNGADAMRYAAIGIYRPAKVRRPKQIPPRRV